MGTIQSKITIAPLHKMSFLQFSTYKKERYLNNSEDAQYYTTSVFNANHFTKIYEFTNLLFYFFCDTFI